MLCKILTRKKLISTPRPSASLLINQIALRECAGVCARVSGPMSRQSSSNQSVCYSYSASCRTHLSVLVRGLDTVTVTHANNVSASIIDVHQLMNLPRNWILMGSRGALGWSRRCLCCMNRQGSFNVHHQRKPFLKSYYNVPEIYFWRNFTRSISMIKSGSNRILYFIFSQYQESDWFILVQVLLIWVNFSAQQ